MNGSADEFLRVGLIGFGRCGAVHAQAWRDCPGVQWAAVCDPDPVARRRAAELGVPAFMDLDEMLEAARLDAVSVCAPPACHGELAARCLKRGLHVLCEKPLTTDVASTGQLFRISGQTGRSLAVSAKFRHVPEVCVTRELVRGGEIGAVQQFCIEFAAVVPMADRWNSQRWISGGGVVMDNGWHVFDLVHFLFDGIRTVRARLESGPQGLDVEESASIEIVAAGGERGRAELSWSRPSSGDEYVSIWGDRGSIHIGWTRSSLKRHGAGVVAFGQAYDKALAHRRMMECFRDAVGGRGQPWMAPEEVLGTAAAIEAAYRSGASQAEELVQEPLRLAKVV